MIDQWGRKIDYLRISVTDRCNLRCIYCMPEKDIEFMPKEELLTIDEIFRIAKLTSELGISKIRITGGEPLVRDGIIKLIKDIKSLENIKEVCLTTNGTLLLEKLESLTNAGLDRVNISLDTLKEDKFKLITGGGDLGTVLKAIDGSINAGIKVKINTVIIKDYNEEEIMDFIKMMEGKPLDVRFIEMMPIGSGKSFGTVTTDEIKERIRKNSSLILCQEYKGNNGPATYYKTKDSLGRIGFISPLSHSFCANCNRIRLTSEGFLKQCLHWKKGNNLEEIMRRGISDTELKEVIKKYIYFKPQGHAFLENSNESDKRYMFQIGG